MLTELPWFHIFYVKTSWKDHFEDQDESWVIIILRCLEIGCEAGKCMEPALVIVDFCITCIEPFGLLLYRLRNFHLDLVIGAKRRSVCV
jgi:hypothetical protein